jgi:hypothetical protein
MSEEAPAARYLHMHTPVVSVVMSVFNGERFLREAIESILSQTFSDFEFIIINDGSTDGSAAILDSYARRDRRVRVFYQENRGSAASDNRGCALASGKYIAHLDQDDVSMPDRLERQVGFLENHEDVGLLGGAFEGIDAQGRRVFLEQPPQEDQSIRAALQPFSFPITHSAVMMRRQAFDATAGYRAQFLRAEDYDLTLRMVEGCGVANLPDVVVRKRIHPQQLSVCDVRQQMLSVLAAHALSLARQRHSIEPLCHEPVITEGFLEQLGVDQSTRQQALVCNYDYWIGTMLRISQDDAVLRLVDELIDLPRSGPVYRSTLSNAMLLAGRIHYRQGRAVRALGYLGRAVLTRPIVLGRPFKQLARRLGLLSTDHSSSVPQRP